MTFEDFLIFERENDCGNLQVDGFHYWWYIREKLIQQCGCLRSEESETGKSTAIKVSKKNKISKMFHFIFIELKFSPFRKGKKKSLFIMQDARFYNPKEAYYECPRTQPVMEFWNGKKTLISDYSNQYDENAFPLQFSETSFAAFPFVYTRVKGYLWKLFRYDKKKKREFKDSISSVLNILKAQYHVSVEPNLISTIYVRYLYWLGYYKYYERLLKRKKPYGIVEQCYYATNKMALNEVARKYHVPVIELQHGIMGEEHSPYNSYIKENNTLPNYILLFSDFWKTCTRFPLSEEKLISIGYPYLEKQLLEGRRECKRKNLDRTLLVIGSDDNEDKELRKFLYEVCVYVSENKISNFRMLYKMHPGFMDYYNDLCCRFSKYSDIFHIVGKDEKNLYDCFLVADEQLSVRSTGIYEGLTYGLKTYIYKVERCKNLLMDALCKEGYAQYINRPEQLFKTEKEESIKDANVFWLSNSKERLMKAIHEILEKENKIPE